MGIFNFTFHRFPHLRSKRERILRKFLLPDAKMFGDWDYWQQRDVRLKRLFPVRYFLFKQIPKKYSSFKTELRWIKSDIRKRLIDRPHILRLRNTKPAYMNCQQQMLHFNFQMLVDFIEFEIASYHDNFKGKRDKKLGTEQLDAIIKDSSTYSAGLWSEKEIYERVKDLYIWWTEYRHHRIDPFTHNSIWGDLLDGDRSYLDYIFSSKLRSKEIDAAYNSAINLSEFYDDEDQERLEVLVKLRKYLVS